MESPPVLVRQLQKFYMENLTAIILGNAVLTTKQGVRRIYILIESRASSFVVIINGTLFAFTVFFRDLSIAYLSSWVLWTKLSFIATFFQHYVDRRVRYMQMFQVFVFLDQRGLVTNSGAKNNK